MMSRSCFYLTRQLAASALLGAALLSSVHASVVVEGTRVVYPANEREVTVRMNNKGHGPVLMQAWVDRGTAEFERRRQQREFATLQRKARDLGMKLVPTA